jgi:hypothetical protein
MRLPCSSLRLNCSLPPAPLAIEAAIASPAFIPKAPSHANPWGEVGETR